MVIADPLKRTRDAVVLKLLRKTADEQPFGDVFREFLCTNRGVEVCSGYRCQECCLGIDGPSEEYHDLLWNIRKFYDLGHMPDDSRPLSDLGTKIEKKVLQSASFSFSSFVRSFVCGMIIGECGTEERVDEKCKRCCLYEDNEESLHRFTKILETLEKEHAGKTT